MSEVEGNGILDDKNADRIKLALENTLLKDFQTQSKEYRDHIDTLTRRVLVGAISVFGIIAGAFAWFFGKTYKDLISNMETQISTKVLNNRFDEKLHKNLHEKAQQYFSLALEDQKNVDVFRKKLTNLLTDIIDENAMKSFKEQAELTLSNFQKTQAELGVTVGTINIIAMKKVPPSWKVCDGSVLEIKDYPELYEKIGTFFGKGIDPGTFMLPDLGGRTPIGYEEEEDFDDVSENIFGSSIGEEKHKLTKEEMPNHTHTSRGNNHSVIEGAQEYQGVGFGDKGKRLFTSRDFLEPQGESRPHNNMQPSLVVNFIIKAK